MKKEELKKMCEWGMCTEKAAGAEAYNGHLYQVCAKHRKVIKMQKKADNNI